MILSLVRPVLSIILTLLLSNYLVNDSGIQSFNANTGTENYISYIVFSILLAIFLINSMIGTGFKLYIEIGQGTLENLFLLPISKYSIILYMTLGQVIVNLFTMVMNLIVVKIVFNIQLELKHYLNFTYLVLLAIFVVSFLGIIISTLVLKFKRVQVAFALASVLTVISGLSYPIDVLPRFIQYIALINPIAYLMEGIKALTFNSTSFISIQYINIITFVFAILLFILSRRAMYKVTNRLYKNGDLSKY